MATDVDNRDESTLTQQGRVNINSICDESTLTQQGRVNI